MVDEIGPGGEQANADELLKPYVPRVLIQWLRDGAATSHRAIDGSLAFVDVSGFTELTERFARRGRSGPSCCTTHWTECSGPCSTKPTSGVRVS